MNAIIHKPITGINQDATFLSIRETVESIAVAVILALLFKTFIAEAFVIPTGSMAPTLMGRHVDTQCPECKLQYQASASAERNREDGSTGLKVVDTRCPNCGFRKNLDIDPYLSNDNSFSGDRIIVSKFAYELRDPQRWDVIVFKFPEGAQQNYIKRLVGLPNETVHIVGGNIYTKPKGESEFKIVRKPPQKILAMLQTVHDSEHPAPRLVAAGWPKFWQPLDPSQAWENDAEGKSFQVAETQNDAWLRYHHVEPMEDVWDAIQAGKKVPMGNWPGRLIADAYAYNSARQNFINEPKPLSFYGDGRHRDDSPAYGVYWVDDLAVECQAEIKSSGDGELLLDSVRGGKHFTCRINTTTGQATLTLPDSDKPLQAATRVKDVGTYRLRLSNVDHEVRLWVNDSLVEFNGPTTYDSPELILPDIADVAAGDLAPVGVGAKNVTVKFSHLKVLRDKYYVAFPRTSNPPAESEYQDFSSLPINSESTLHSITDELADPTPKRLFPLLESRRTRVLELGEGQYMPLGDNSPASSDARYWDHPYVERHLLVGRAVCIYWPHSWWNPICWPNFGRMKPIH